MTRPNKKLRVLGLFSGIGGFELGLQRAGFEIAAMCEIDPFCRRVLAKHWPGVPIYEDVRELTGERLAADGIGVDVICGGFPCQDISVAGKGAGLAGERSGLWREYARIIGELRPRFVIVENVAALLGRGLAEVLGDLSTLGYDAEWHCIPAAAVGAPHRRDRLWIVADTLHRGHGQHVQPLSELGSGASANSRRNGKVRSLAHAARSERAGKRPFEDRQSDGLANRREDVADADASDKFWRRGTLQMGWGRFASQTLENGDASGTQWGTEPDVGRVANGVPDRVERLGGLGNAVVPQIPELIGKAILETLNFEI